MKSWLRSAALAVASAVAITGVPAIALAGKRGEFSARLDLLRV